VGRCVLISVVDKWPSAKNWTLLDLSGHPWSTVRHFRPAPWGVFDRGYMLSAAKSNPRTLTPAFEPLLDLHEAASVLGMHWKTLEGKA
jgi:hypothetical protein